MAVSTVLAATLLVAIDVAGYTAPFNPLGTQGTPAYADPPSANAPTLVTLAVDKPVISATEQATLVATTDIAVQLSYSSIKITDQTTGSLIKTCTTGTTCSITQKFYTGGPHTYIAQVGSLSSNTVEVTRQAWTVSIASASPTFPTGGATMITATANQNVSNTNGNYKIYIFNTTLNFLQAVCSAGTTCTSTASGPYSGGAYSYVAVVAASAPSPSNLAAAVDVQAQSNSVSVSRLPWTVALTTNLTALTTTQAATLTATANQNVGLTGSSYRIYIFDVTAGTRIASCTTGTTCVASGTIRVGGPHDYVAVVGASGTPPTISSVLDTQATSNTINLSRSTWTLTAATSTPTPAAGVTPTITVTANQFVNVTYTDYVYYVFDADSGARVASCANGSSCTMTVPKFNTGGPKSYVAVIASPTSPATRSAAVDVQAESNIVVITRAPWTVSLAAPIPVFQTTQNGRIVATMNQSPNATGSSYKMYLFDITAGTLVSQCTAGTSCTVDTRFGTGDPHDYVAVVGAYGSPTNPSQVLDVQATSNVVTLSRLPWTISLSVQAESTGYSMAYRLTAGANQTAEQSLSAYIKYIFDLTTGQLVKACPVSYSSCSPLVPMGNGHAYVAYIARPDNGQLPIYDIQATSNIFYSDGNPYAGLEDETVGGGNLAESNCQCSHADPVNSATGEFYLPETDLSISGVGPSLSIGRTYSTSLRDYDGSFGPGWASPIDSRIEVMVAGASGDPVPRQVRVVQENGSTVEFTKDATGAFHTRARVMATLAFNSATQQWTFVRSSTTTMLFNVQGQVTEVRDLHANALQITRNSSGKATQLSASGGRSIDITWSGGHIQQVADSAGRVVSYSYGSLGNLTGVTGTDGSVTTYGYNAALFMTSLTKPGGATTTNVFDTFGRVTSQTDPIGRVTSFSYSGTTTTITAPGGSQTVEVYTEGRLASQTVAAGTPIAATTTYTYDFAGNMLSATAPLSAVTTFTYDAAGNVLTTTDPLSRVTTWTYDQNRRPLSTTDPMGRVSTATYNSVGDLLTTTSAGGRVQSWTHNANGTMATATDALGKVSTYVYDGAGRLISSTDADGRTTSLTYNAAGLPSSSTGPGGSSTAMTYDAAGRLTTITDANGNSTEFRYDAAGNQTSVADAAEQTSFSAFDLAGQLLSTTDATGVVSQFTYTPAGQLASTADGNNNTATYVYDARGRLTATTDPTGNTTLYSYDAAGRLVSQTSPSGAVSTASYDVAGQLLTATDANAAVTQFAYDLAGRVLSTTDPLGRVTSTSYTLDGEPSTVTLPDFSTQSVSYDANGRQLTFTNADGKVSSYAYSDSGLLTTSTEPGALTATHSYNAAGHLATTTLADGSIAAYEYDGLGRIVEVHHSAPGSADLTYTYDEVGRLTAMSDSTGTSTFGYDAAGRLLSESNGADATIAYSYGELGRLSSITYPGDRTATYGYDAAGRMTSVTDWLGNATAFSWTPDGQLAEQVYPNGVVQGNDYDLAGQLTDISVSSGEVQLAEFIYGYDLAGQTTASSTTFGSATVASDYGYDPISQLASVTVTPSGGSATLSELDATHGGLLTTTVDGDTLSYNSAQQLTSLIPLLGLPTAYTYDARGSRVSATTGTDVSSYLYTQSGALASVTTPTASVTYTSDARNLRQSRTSGGVTHQFTWSSVGGLPLLLDDGDHSYVYGPSSTPLAQVDDSTGLVEYLHVDLLGTPRLVTDSAGSPVGTVSFNVFGTVVAHSGVQSAFGFTGNLTDPDTGLLYLRARDYDPVTGQFLTVDPLVDRTRQPYTYVGNNPALLTDPWGLAEWWDIGNWDADNWQDAGALVAGIGAGVLVGAAIAGAGICTAATFGLCGVAVLVVGGAIAGAAAGAVTYGLQSGPKSICGFGEAVGFGALGGALGGPVGGLINKVAAPILKSLLGKISGTAANGIRSAAPSSFVRTHAISGGASSRTVASLARSMQDGGWGTIPPIDVVELGGQRIIVDGHHRVAAALRSGIDALYQVVDPASVIGPGQWSSVDDIIRDTFLAGPNRLR